MARRQPAELDAVQGTWATDSAGVPRAAGESSAMYQSPPPLPSISRWSVRPGAPTRTGPRAGDARPARRRWASAPGSSRAARSIMRLRWAEDGGSYG
ncbi:hypothetical protein ADK38_29785 [Streptomyces varsoviensis]|uniref:Uncharacterized protein n=1 Tax=Streptomyces varsoviensis TaxID=67373 RepID=A0ABR5IZT3_9ACTN|nr:hypothetical protein ADK38_29785 [Streptomyces varsoviensis]